MKVISRRKIHSCFLIIAILLLTFNIYNQSVPVNLKLLNSGDNESYNESKFIVQEIINHQRLLNEAETSGYIFPSGTQLSNYTLSTNGTPIRSIIITARRSGSSFLGEILNSIPGSYYFYEPLGELGYMETIFKAQSVASQRAINDLKKLLNCNYKRIKNYENNVKVMLSSTMKTANTIRNFMIKLNQNKRLWNQRNWYNIRWNTTFLTDFCREFPFQTMKITRLRLKLAEEFLIDKSLNAKVLLLIRDPRAVMASRKELNWCKQSPECISSKSLCSDMVSNYKAAVQLHKKYPDAFKVIRFEELALDLYNVTHELLDFFNLNFHSDVKSFLDSHTKKDEPGRDPSTVYRNSKSVPFLWKKKLTSGEIQSIEENCSNAMKLWGYKKIINKEGLKNFNRI